MSFLYHSWSSHTRVIKEIYGDAISQDDVLWQYARTKCMDGVKRYKSQLIEKFIVRSLIACTFYHYCCCKSCMAKGAYYKLRQKEYLLSLHRLMMLTWLYRAISGISKKTATTLKIARENEFSRSFRNNSGRKTFSRYGIIWKGFLISMLPLLSQKENTFLAVNPPPLPPKTIFLY